MEGDGICVVTLDPLPSPGRRELSRSKTLVMRSSRVQLAYFEVSVMIRRCLPERRNLYRNQIVIPIRWRHGDDTDQSPQVKLESQGVVGRVRR